MKRPLFFQPVLNELAGHARPALELVQLASEQCPLIRRRGCRCFVFLEVPYLIRGRSLPKLIGYDRQKVLVSSTDLASSATCQTQKPKAIK